MRYYINKLSYVKPSNKKLEMVVNFLLQFEHTLIEGNFYRFISDVEDMVKSVNEQFQRSKKIKLKVIDASEVSENITLYIEYDPATSDQSIARLSLNPVKDTIYFQPLHSRKKTLINLTKQNNTTWKTNSKDSSKSV